MTVPSPTSASTAAKKVTPPLTALSQRSAGSAGNRYDKYCLLLQFTLIILNPHAFSPQGHVKDDCPEPDRCYNCREEGHTTADCPEPEKCRRCRKEGHKVDECPEPVKCGK